MNPEERKRRIAQAALRWYYVNRDQVLAKRKQTAGYHRQCSAEWRKANPAKHRAAQALRYARQRLATIGDLTDIAKVYERAAELRQWFEVEVDHIKPLAKGGTHEASNLQIIYAYENRRKHALAGYKVRVIFS
jgi:HNH endonuclease